MGYRGARVGTTGSKASSASATGNTDMRRGMNSFAFRKRSSAIPRAVICTCSAGKAAS